MHRPPFSSGKHGGHEATLEAFVPLFEEYGVDLVLAGHDHNYERTESIGGVTYIVETATDLDDWESGPGLVEEIGAPVANGDPATGVGTPPALIA